MNVPKQCAILVGGFGTRLGALTAGTPKPLLPCGDRPFLAWILRELVRFGIEDIVLLAGYRSEKIEQFCREVGQWLPKQLRIRVSVEPEPAGTGGALWFARDILEDSFLLLNGDSWISANLAPLFALSSKVPEAIGSILLRRMPDCDRYGTAATEGPYVVKFREKFAGSGEGLINGGIYLLRREVLDLIAPKCSLEMQVLPVLAERRQLVGQEFDGYFIDIGVPSDYELARRELPGRLHRKALFFNATELLAAPLDGNVGNESVAQHLRRACERGFHVFVRFTQQPADGPEQASYASQYDLLLSHALRSGFTIDDYVVLPDVSEGRLQEFLCRWEIAWSDCVSLRRDCELGFAHTLTDMLPSS